MSADRNIFSNDFGPNTQIHQGDIHYYSSNAPRKAFFVLPLPPNEDIIRRPEIDAQLDELLLPSKAGRYCSLALWGLGGSGKTQIALDYAYHRSAEDPTCDIFWVHADDETSFAQDYHSIARKLGVDSKLNGEEMFLEVRNRIESQKNWLLILDNADDVTCFGVGAEDHTNNLLKFIPGGPGGTVLWTSRDKQIVALCGWRRGIEIPHMAIEEAEKLFSMARDKDIQENEIQDARLLLQELQWLPLAISQAGSFMRRTSTPIRKYLSRLLKGKSRWDTLMKTQHDKHRRPEVSNSILETWNISIRHIGQESHMAYKILHTIAYIDNQNIPLSAILAISLCFDESSQETTGIENVLETVIVRLQEFSFIRARKAENDAEPIFDMHKLVQDAIRYTLNTRYPVIEECFSGTALIALTRLFPEEVKQQTWPLCQKYATHAIQVTNYQEDTFDDVIIASDLLRRVAEYFKACGFLKKAEDTAKKELRLAKKELKLVTEISATKTPITAEVFNTHQLPIAIAMAKLSEIYRSQGLFEEAEKYALETVAFSEMILGEKHSGTALLTTLLIKAYCCQGQFRKAEELQKKQLLILQEILGEKHPNTIIAMSNLALMYDEQKLYDKAKKLKVQALAFSSEIFGERHSATIDLIGCLAKTYRLARQLKEAKWLETRILALRQQSQWEEHPKIHDLDKLVEAYVQHGQFGEAKDLQKRILLLQQNSLGEKHLDTVQAMQTLSTIHYWVREFQEAEELQLKALAFLHETFGEKNERTILAMGSAAQIYYTQGLTEKGEEYKKRAISLISEIYGNNPPPKLLLKFEDITFRRLARRFLLRHRLTEIYPSILDRQLAKHHADIELFQRRLFDQFLPVVDKCTRRLTKQRLIKLAQSTRHLFKQRLLKLRQSHGHISAQRLLKLRLSMQNVLERRVSKFELSLRRRELKLRLWANTLLERHTLQSRLRFQRLKDYIMRHIESC